MRGGDQRRQRGSTARRLALVAISLAALTILSPPARAQGDENAATLLAETITAAETDTLVLSPAIDDQLQRSAAARFARLSVPNLDAQLATGTLALQLNEKIQATFVVVEREAGLLGFSTTIARNPDTDETATVVRHGEVVSMSLSLASGRWHVSPVRDNIYLVAHEGRPVVTATPRAARSITAPAPAFDALPPGTARHVVERLAGTDGVQTVVTSGVSALGPGVAPPPPQVGLAAGPTTTVIDVMIWYDDPTLAFYGSAIAAEAAIVTSVGSANAAFLASGVDASLAISDLSHVTYTGSGNSFNDLTKLRAKYDGVLDDVHTVRDSTNSDLVALVSVLNDGFCGRADLLQQLPSITTDDQAFSIIHAGCLTNETYAHEIGHNMGAAHDDANTFGSDGVFPWSRGYVDTTNQFVTVMSYANGSNGCFGCTRVPQFSSPTETWMGFATGDVDHDNSGTFDQTRTGIAAYRPSPCPPPANDDYPVRDVLPQVSLATATGSNVCATVENLETYFIGTEPVESVWYEWTAPFDGTASFSTCSAATDFDTTITVYDDNPVFSNLGILGHNDDAGAGCAVDPTHSTVAVPVAMGTAYRFKVDGVGAVNGNFEVQVQVDTMCDALPVTSYLDRGENGTNGADVILGTPGADVINGLAGDDIICGLDGADTINGGGGSDTIFGGDGDDVLSGQGDVDILHGEGDNDRLNGGNGDDQLFGGPGQDDLRGQGDNDTLNGGNDVDQFFGGSGNDTINTGDGGNLGTGLVVNGGGNNDIITGSPQDDLILGQFGLDELYGMGGNDTLNGGGGSDDLFGGAGNDTLIGAANRDFLFGGDDDDTLNGGTGDDDLFGESGDDTLNGQGNTDLCDGGTTGQTTGDTATATCETLINIP